ncbi:MAG: multi-sensor hybrid histidine kinase [Acidobacteriaceae bacterium]|nr:multi-sensor hybrid histidine kinase [Acidobacteriaceae bacterium]
MAASTQLKYEALAQQWDALQVIFESLPVGVIVADSEGRLLFSNPAAETILGNGSIDLTPQDATSIYGWYSPDQVTLLDQEQLPLVRAIHGETVADEVVFVRTLQQRSGVWIKVNAWPLPDSMERVCGGVVVFHNITKDREAMQALILLAQVVTLRG